MARATDFSKSVPLSYRANPTTGVVSLTGRLARPGLLLYSANESPTGSATIVYRSPEVVSAPAYLASIKGSLISPDHSFRAIDKGGSGVVTNASYIDGHVAIDLMLTDPRVITEVRSGTRQLSAGYTYDYDVMGKTEILAAKNEFMTDWDTISSRLHAANIDRVQWIRATNLVNNHVSLVSLGRAGVTCAIDEEIMDEELNSQGLEVALEGELETTSEDAAAESDMATTATQMMMQLLDLVESLKTALEGAGMAFDTKGFAADRVFSVTTTAPSEALSSVATAVTDLGSATGVASSLAATDSASAAFA